MTSCDGTSSKERGKIDVTHQSSGFNPLTTIVPPGAQRLSPKGQIRLAANWRYHDRLTTTKELRSREVEPPVVKGLERRPLQYHRVTYHNYWTRNPPWTWVPALVAPCWPCVCVVRRWSQVRGSDKWFVRLRSRDRTSRGCRRGGARGRGSRYTGGCRRNG